MPLPKTIKATKTIQIEIDVINHKEVSYNNNKYIVCYIPYNNKDKLFVIDEFNKNDVIEKKWHYKNDKGYISHSCMNEGERMELSLHNLLMNKDQDKKQKTIIEHINNFGCDNRIENLQQLTEIELMYIQQKRTLSIPSEIGINISDIPKYITYRKADASHGDKFIIEIKLESGDIKWQSTSAKNISAKEKLKNAILKLEEFNNTNKELIELNKKFNNTKKRSDLINSYNEIIRKSGYPIEIIQENLIPIEIELFEPINDNEYINEYINEKTLSIIEQKIKQNIIQTINGTRHSNVVYNNKKYTVGYCSRGNEEILFVIDFDKNNSIINDKWYYNKDTKYIYRNYINNEGIKSFLYQHIYMIYGLTLEQDHAFSIDHINQIGRDNRLENLRKLTISHQNINRGKLKRNIELPEGCGINPQDIPTNIYYRKPQGLHGDRFYVEIKYSDPPFLKDSTSSKSIDLKTKLQQAIYILEEYKKKNPEYALLVDGIKNIDNRNDLRKSFNEIIKLSGFPQEIIEQNLVPVEDETEVIEDQEAQDLAKQLIDQGYKNITSSLPLNCGVTPDMIPKYCYYKPAKDKRGDKFIIERHPKLTEKGVRQWATTESKTKTTKEKFDLLIEKYKELEK